MPRVNYPTKSNTTTTTLVPGIAQPYGIEQIDILRRFPRSAPFYELFAPVSIYLDRYITPFWLPFALLGCTICAVVYTQTPRKTASQIHTKASRNPWRNTAVSVFLSALAIIRLIDCFLILLLDLDISWDTGLLGWNQFICPFIHTLESASHLAATLLTILIGVEALKITRHEDTRQLVPMISKICSARASVQGSIRLVIGISLASLGVGFVETAYWRVLYYQPEINNEPISTKPLLARCEVPGLYRSLLQPRQIDHVSRFIQHSVSLDEQNYAIAESYRQYKWISSLITGCFLAFINTGIALSIMRARLARGTGTPDYISEVKYISLLGLVQGLCTLPEAFLYMLEPLSRPNNFRLTDIEIQADGSWQRYFTMHTAQAIASEIAQLPSVLLLPICFTLSKVFRMDFQNIFGCDRRFRGGKYHSQTHHSVTAPKILNSEPARKLNYSAFPRPGVNRNAPPERSSGHVGLSSPQSERYVTQGEYRGQTRLPTEVATKPVQYASTRTGSIPTWQWGQGWTVPRTGSNFATQTLIPQTVTDSSSGHNTSHSLSRLLAPTNEPFSRCRPCASMDNVLDGRMVQNRYIKRSIRSQQRRMKRNPSFNSVVGGASVSQSCSQLYPGGSLETDWFEPRSFI